MGRLIFRAFQCEMELDYITVSRLLLLVPVANVCESIENRFQLIYQNLSWLQYCVLLPCVCLRNILRKWFVTTVSTLPTHVLQPQNFVRIFCNDSEAIFHVFQLFSQEVKYFYQKTFEKIRKSYSFSENDLKYEITLANSLFWRESKLPISLEQFYLLQLLEKLRLVVTGSCNSSHRQQVWIKGGATGAIAPDPPLEGGPP